jgi:hypothetical protein
MAVKARGDTMIIQAAAAGRRRFRRNEVIQDILQDVLIVSSFALWAMLLGFAPLIAVQALAGG